MIIQTMGFPLAVQTVEPNPQEITYEFSGWFYVTIIAFVLIFATSIFATVIKLMAKRHNKH